MSGQPLCPEFRAMLSRVSGSQQRLLVGASASAQANRDTDHPQVLKTGSEVDIFVNAGGAARFRRPLRVAQDHCEAGSDSVHTDTPSPAMMAAASANVVLRRRPLSLESTGSVASVGSSQARTAASPAASPAPSPAPSPEPQQQQQQASSAALLSFSMEAADTAAPAEDAGKGGADKARQAGRPRCLLLDLDVNAMTQV